MIEVLKYKNTGMEYIRGKARTLVRIKGERSGMFITNPEFDDWDSRNILFAQVLGLKNDKDRGGFDFDHAAETGLALPLQHDAKPATNLDNTEPLPGVEEPAAPPPLVNARNEADEEAVALEERKLNEHGPIDVPTVERTNIADADTPTTEELIAKAIKEHSMPNRVFAEPAVNEQKRKKHESLISIHTSRDIMLWIMLIVGVLSLIMSTYHIINYLIGPRGWFVAYVSAIAMTLFSSSAFTTGRYFFFLGKTTAKLKNRLIAAAFWSMGIGVVIYAMFATMDVNFNDFRNRQQAATAVAVVGDSAVKSANQKDADLRKEADRLDGILSAADAEKAPWLAEVNRLTRALANQELTDEARASLAQSRSSAQYRANLIEDRVKVDRAKRSKIGDQLTGTGDATVAAENVVRAAAEKGTFFALLNSIFGWDIETMKLIVYIIPAVFYDLMAPFALTVVMILEEKREEDENEAVPSK